MTTTNAHAVSNIRNSGGRAGSPVKRQYLPDLVLTGGDLSPRARTRKSSASSIDCTSSANETTSTATTITEPSHDNHQDQPPIESALMRTRTNFGHYQFYVPPETKASPYRVPTGAPVSPRRDSWSSPSSSDRRVPQKLKFPFLPSSPERESPEDREHAISPTPLDEKRLQFFDDVASDQVPFDQVWNQQEFALDDHQNMEDKELGELDQSLRSVTSKPFDERQEESRIGVSDSSAFSAFAASNSAALPPPPPPPPPPPVAWHKKQASPRSPRHKRGNSNGNGGNSSSTSTTPIQRNEGQTPTHSGRQTPTLASSTNPISAPVESPRRSSPEARDNPYSSDEDIPSDEDETKLRRLDAPDAAQLSLATASKRTTAENVGTKKAAEDLSSAGSPNRTDQADDDKSVDSLFDFEKRLSLSASPRSLDVPPGSPSRSPRQWRKKAPVVIIPKDDEATHDAHDINDGHEDTGLRARAQEAFAARKRFSPSPSHASPRRPTSPRRATSPPQKVIAAVPIPPPLQLQSTAGVSETGATPTTTGTQSLEPAVAPAPARGPRVSFTTKNTVHTFRHEYDMYSQSESAVSGGTYEDATTDVEEAIKDIFMINALGACNPSPRQLRHDRDTRFERRDSEQSDNYSDDADSLGKSDDDSKGSTNAGSRSLPEREQSVEEKLKSVPSQNEESDVFFDAMLSMVEGGLGAMSAALGFATGVASSAGATKSRSRTAGTSGDAKSPRKSRRNSRSSRANDQLSDGVFDSMSDYVFGSERSDSYEDVSDEDLESDAPRDEREFDAKRAPMPPTPAEVGEEDTNEPQSLEDDPRLLELAKQSALCMHEVLGVRYDEARGVDISDVKFVVVVLALPLGIIFQEDYSGCWITKIMPKGNAEQSGKIEPGDQLAAINGKSSIGMKVDDICAAISVASSQAKEIELTFLRYIGPFQPLQSDGAPPIGVLKDQGETPSIGMGLYQIDLDEKPQSTMSVTERSLDSSKSGKKSKGNSSLGSKSPKRGSLRKKFKWLSRGKKQQKGAE